MESLIVPKMDIVVDGEVCRAGDQCLCPRERAFKLVENGKAEMLCEGIATYGGDEARRFLNGEIPTLGEQAASGGGHIDAAGQPSEPGESISDGLTEMDDG